MNFGSNLGVPSMYRILRRRTSLLVPPARCGLLWPGVERATCEVEDSAPVPGTKCATEIGQIAIALAIVNGKSRDPSATLNEAITARRTGWRLFYPDIGSAEANPRENLTSYRQGTAWA